MVILDSRLTNAHAAQAAAAAAQAAAMAAASASTASSTTASTTPSAAASVVSMAPNQYLNPDYVSPLTDADSKTSPLAMLAKTCSQIGADTNGILKSDGQSNAAQLAAASRLRNGKSSSVSPDKGLYGEGARSRSSSVEIKVSDPILPANPPPPKAPSSATSSLSPASTATSVEDKTLSTSPATSPKSTKAPSRPSSEVRLQAQPPTPSPVTTSAASQLMNPFLAAAAGLIPPPAQATSTSSSATSPPCRDPLCRDPICPTSMRNAQLLAAATGAFLPPTTTTTSSSAAMLLAQQREAMRVMASASGGPYVCNWVSGISDYCGRRFTTSEELLLHLKTHTNLSVPSLIPPPPSGSAAAAAAAAAAASAHHPHLQSRFHPYARPSAMPPVPPPPGPAGYLNPYAAAALYPSLFAAAAAGGRPPML